jgi:Nse4 C-terminal
MALIILCVPLRPSRLNPESHAQAMENTYQFSFLIARSSNVAVSPEKDKLIEPRL